MDFHEFSAGQVIDCGSYTVSREEIVEFAQKYDPQWFHIDEERARQSRWQGIIASGWHICAIAMRLVSLNVLASSTVYGSPGVENVRWKEPMRPGDSLRVRFSVLSTQVSSSGRTGILRHRWLLLNQNDREVMEIDGVSLFEINVSNPIAPEAVAASRDRKLPSAE